MKSVSRLPSTIVASAALLAIAGVAAASPPDFPRLKSGLWEVSMMAAGRDGQPPRVTMMCLDDSVQQDMYKLSTGMMSGMCSRHDIRVSGNKVTTIANCDLGVTKLQSQSVMTLAGNTAYHTEAHATFDPPLNGAKESTTIIDGKHLGACNPGQQPGDMTLPGGKTVNVRQLLGRKEP